MMAFTLAKSFKLLIKTCVGMKKKSLNKLSFSKKQIAKMNPASASGGWGTYTACGWTVYYCWEAPLNGDEGPENGNLCGGGWW
jgi:hypothetical protein